LLIFHQCSGSICPGQDENEPVEKYRTRPVF
jgi:hypothetical protein